MTVAVFVAGVGIGMILTIALAAVLIRSDDR